jgi:hypothetical protein
LIAVCAISTAYAGHYNQKVNNNMALAMANEAKINARHGFTHHLQVSPLEGTHVIVEATTAPPTISGWL